MINGLLRNTLDVKRAELVLRALHVAVRNARNLKLDNVVYPMVTEVPEYAEPETKNVETAAFADEYLPAVAAVTYKPVDPRGRYWLERMEEDMRVLPREEAERRGSSRCKGGSRQRRQRRITDRDASTAPQPAALGRGARHHRGAGYSVKGVPR